MSNEPTTPAQDDAARLAEIRRVVASGNGLYGSDAAFLLRIIDEMAQENAKLEAEYQDRYKVYIETNDRWRKAYYYQEADARLGAALRPELDIIANGLDVLIRDTFGESSFDRADVQKVRDLIEPHMAKSESPL